MDNSNVNSIEFTSITSRSMDSLKWVPLTRRYVQSKYCTDLGNFQIRVAYMISRVKGGIFSCPLRKLSLTDKTGLRNEFVNFNLLIWSLLICFAKWKVMIVSNLFFIY